MRRPRVSDESLKRALDHRGLRGSLALAASCKARLRHLPVTRIFHRQGLWIHKCRGGWVVDRSLNTRHSLTRFDEVAVDTWGRSYAPCAGDTVIEVGAGIGSETHWLSKVVGPHGSVVAIEAHPKTFRCLRLFCELNELSNVRPLNLAVSDAMGTIAITDEEHHKSSTIMLGKGTLEVRAVTLDHLFEEAGITHADYVKMNIEGAERLAIRGMAASVDTVGHFAISCHDFKADRGDGEFFRTRKEVCEFLEGAGFAVAPRSQDTRAWIREQVNAERLALATQ